MFNKIYQLQDTPLGEGISSKVLKAKNVITGKQFAIKVIKEGQDLGAVLKEAHILKKVSGHKNVVNLVKSGFNGKIQGDTEFQKSFMYL